MRVLIHAGIHRTGTTTLQRMLAANRGALAAQGVAYPGEGASQQPFVWSLKRGESGPREALALVEAAAEEEGIRRVVLSGEDFCILEDMRWLEALAARHEVKAVFYLRRQDHWVNSWYNQHVKWPFERAKSKMSPEAFLARLEDFHWLDYARTLSRWEAALGPGRVAAAVVEPGQVEDVAQDFLARLGVAREGLEIDAERVNDSLPVHMLEIARHMGLIDLGGGKRSRLLDALRRGLADKGTGARTVYSPRERQAVLDRFADSNREVARRWFGREALFLERPPAPEDPFFRFPDIPRDELLEEWVAPVVRELLKPKRKG